MIASITTAYILQIHEEVIENSGGGLGVRDINLIHSAVMRMHATAFGIELYPTLFQKSATLLHSLIKNHGFVDGNKRSAFVAMETFLIMNGIEKKKPKDKDVEDFVLRVAKENLEINEISAWIEANYG